MPHSNIAPLTRNRARELRQKRTKAELAMWNVLRDFNRAGAKFRRETPIGPYIADFAWLSAKIIVEVDGDSHATDAGLAHDQARDRFLASQGYRVLRFTNPEVVEGPDAVICRLQAELKGLIDEQE